MIDHRLECILRFGFSWRVFIIKANIMLETLGKKKTIYRKTSKYTNNLNLVSISVVNFVEYLYFLLFLLFLLNSLFWFLYLNSLIFLLFLLFWLHFILSLFCHFGITYLFIYFFGVLWNCCSLNVFLTNWKSIFILICFLIYSSLWSLQRWSCIFLYFCWFRCFCINRTNFACLWNHILCWFLSFFLFLL